MINDFTSLALFHAQRRKKRIILLLWWIKKLKTCTSGGEKEKIGFEPGIFGKKHTHDLQIGTKLTFQAFIDFLRLNYESAQSSKGIISQTIHFWPKATLFSKL